MATLTKSTGTVTLKGAVEKVTLPAAYGWVWVKNMSEGNIFAGISADISEGADGIMSIPAGEAGRIQMDGSCEFYLLGSGNALVVAQNYADCPFKAGVKGGGADVGGESSYTLKNAVDYPLLGLNLYGKSTQDGTPTPDNPVEIVSVGDSGTVNITSNNGGDITASAAITSALPLCGIPVESGGNYTDSNGQQWVCDELVYNADGSGKIVKHTKKIIADGVNVKGTFMTYSSNYNITQWYLGLIPNLYIGPINFGTAICSHTVLARQISDTYSHFVPYKDGTIKYIRCWFAGIGATTTEELNVWLQSNPVTFVYQIEPQEIELTAAEMSALRELQTYNGITNISNDGGADMSVKYCTNKTLSEYVMPITTGLQAQIDELKAAVLSLGGNV